MKVSSALILSEKENVQMRQNINTLIIAKSHADFVVRQLDLFLHDIFLTTEYRIPEHLSDIAKESPLKS